MSAPLTDAEIAEARALCQAASRGPWDFVRWRSTRKPEGVLIAILGDGRGGEDEMIVESRAALGNTPDPLDDARFIAAARSLLPRLLDELVAARAKRRP